MNLADLPSRRVEGWRWTDLRAALANAPAPLANLRSQPDLGALGPIAALAEALTPPDRSEGLLFDAAGRDVLHVQQSDAGESKTLKLLKGCRGVLVQTIGPGAVRTPLLASHAQIEIEDEASLIRIVIQPPCEGAESPTILNSAHVRLARGGKFRQFTFTEGARLSRIETDIIIDGEGTEVALAGLYLCSRGRHADLTSRVRFGAPGANVRQLAKGVVRNGGRGVFQGKFNVGREGQHTDARMTHRALLLENGAEAFAKPELEIYADDVACGHGNAIGQLDRDQVFYLRSRGIPEREALAVLSRAFLGEALPDWLPPECERHIRERIDLWLGADGAGSTM